jgi:hypothetical protein
MKASLFLLFFIGICVFSSCQPSLKEDKSFLTNLMKRYPDEFQSILAKKKDLEVQIIYTQINRDANNRPTFKSFFFNVDSTRYFYPASTVKLPVALLALEKLNELNIDGLDKNTIMFHDSVYSGQIPAKADLSSENLLPSIGHYIKKILLVSHNEAYNRLYEFVGQKEINGKLKRKGYNIRILHRLDRSATPDENRHTEAVRFIENDKVIYRQPSLVNPDSIKPVRTIKKGRGYIKDQRLIVQPFDFTYKNSYPLEEQQEILKAILFPQAVAPEKRFNISEEDRKFVLRYMSQLPRETLYPEYHKDTAYFDTYVKFLMFGEDRKKVIPPNIRVFNKVGDAYGFMIDNAYIVDFEKNVEFILSAVINTNTDGIYNDNKYEYETIGYPFMKNLGQEIYDYELKRKREHIPDLSEFKLTYDR